MKTLAKYVFTYFAEVNKYSFLYISLIVTCLITVNYIFTVNADLLKIPIFSGRLISFYALYLFTFTAAYGVSIDRNALRTMPLAFFGLVFAAPLIFAAKVSLQHPSVLLQWPLKALLVCVMVGLCARFTRQRWPFYGLQLSGVKLAPYLYLLLIMIPVLVIAGMGADFQRAYPKLQLLDDKELSWARVVLFELSYALDFFTIELFFRGFLVIAFIKYVGKAAILPMAAFYCVIHFGKPVAECVSSYFGGLILGAIICHTRSIWGGLVVHLGIAWLMEIIAIVM